MSGAHRELASRFGKFIVVGGTGVVVNSAALFTGYQLLRLPLVLAAGCALALAVLNNYILNDRWTFSQQRPSMQRFTRFAITSLSGMAITSTILWALVTYLQVHYLLANLIGLGFASVTNFVINSTWTWAGSAAR